MVCLLVDDDASVHNHVLKLLKADGFTILTAGDGESALETSRNHLASIDLLLTDMKLPRMTGLELCRVILVERPEIKVLLMLRDMHEREQVSMIGFPFLQKPFSATAVRDSIEALLGPPPSQ